MQFLLVVLTILLTLELINNKRKDNNENNAGEMNDVVRHPAEFELR